MKKRIKDKFRRFFPKKLIEEQKVISVVKKAHRKEQKLFNRLLEENCDNDYISDHINDFMKYEILHGINKYFPHQNVYFAVPVSIEDEHIHSQEYNDRDYNDGKLSDGTKEKSHKDNGTEKRKFLDFFRHKDKKSDKVRTEETKPEKNLLTYTPEISDTKIHDTDDIKSEYKNLPVVSDRQGGEVVYESMPEDKEYWLINALNGYRNDEHRIQNYSTSMCLIKNGKICFSVVFDWYENNVYYAVKGKGAYVDGKRIRTSQNYKVDRAIVSFRLGARGLNDNIELQKTLTPYTLTMQSYSNIAMEMCFVASGKIDACADVAVMDPLSYKIGKLIVEEAGGKVSNFSGEEYIDSDNILVSNNILHSPLLKMIKNKLLLTSFKKAFKITKTFIKFVSLI